MNITVTAEQIQNDEITAQVSIPAATVDAAITEAYKTFAQRYRFQGFRKGRAPRPVIDGIVGRDAVRAEATNEILQEALPIVIDELDIVPVGDPSFPNATDLVKDHEDFVPPFVAKIVPVHELKSYEDFTVRMPPLEATDAEIDREIDTFLSYQTRFENIDQDRGVLDNDFVRASVENIKGCKGIDGENKYFNVGSSQIPKGFSEGLIGMRAGEEKEITWTDVHEHGKHTHEAECACKVTIQGIQKIVTPELTDEFCKKTYGFDTIEEFRTEIAGEIEAEKRSKYRSLLEDRVAEEAAKRLGDIEIPEQYEKDIYQENAQAFLNNLEEQGMTLDNYLLLNGININDFMAELARQGRARARQTIALDAIAAHLGFDVTDEDIRKEFIKADVAEENLDVAIENFRGTGRMPAIRAAVKRNKAIEWLCDNSEVETRDEVGEFVAQMKKDFENATEEERRDTLDIVQENLAVSGIETDKISDAPAAEEPAEAEAAEKPETAEEPAEAEPEATEEPSAEE